MKKVLLKVMIVALLIFAFSAIICGCTSNSFVVKWIDGDGTILYQEEYSVDEEISTKLLPQNNSKWLYENWEKTKDSASEKIYTAIRKPNPDYFKGNVFQIIVQDINQVPIASGTGFVFDDDGWFITNCHVLNDAHFATAIFEIENTQLNEAYTYLNIDKASFKHSDKDLFIGKLSNYNTISSFYHDLGESEQFSVGEQTYSIGYPNSSCELEVHSGTVISDISLLYDKLYSGVKYIGSNSYIAPGSSGGILVNKNLQIIGLTTWGATENNEFKYGASIAYTYFDMYMESFSNDVLLKDLIGFNYEDNLEYINLYLGIKNNPNSIEDIFQNETIFYKYEWEESGTNNQNIDYEIKYKLYVYSDNYIEFSEEYFWGNGEKSKSILYGYYSTQNGIDNLDYEFNYTWNNGKFYTIKCGEINYDTNIAFTLLNLYVDDNSFGLVVSDSNKEYCKSAFNYIYEYLVDMIEIFN